MNAFKIRASDGRVLDYLKSQELDLDKIRTHFSKEYQIKDLRQPGRHVIATVNKNNTDYILKLSSTEGVGVRTETEALWNDEFNKFSKNSAFRVPKNLDDGYYEGLYYLLMEKLEGEHLSTLRGENYIADKYIDAIVEFSELIQNLPLDIPSDDVIELENHQEWFVAKTKSWYENINEEITKQFELDKLMKSIEEGSRELKEKPRHGDFTPWHMITLKNGGLGLIDGEHAHSHGVEYYDIAYFIQRVFSVLNRREEAEKIVGKLLERKYDLDKLKTVLISRAIGGFNDEFLTPVPNYKRAQEFTEFITGL